MYYDKRIRYLSYYESGIKLQNAGYVKFQVRDNRCQMVIYVKGPRLMGSGEAKVYLLSEGPEKKTEDGFYQEGRKNNLQKHLLGTLNIRNGQGYCAVRLNAEDMADSGLWYDEICGIKIELHEYQYLESRWNVIHFMPEQRRRRRSDEVREEQESANAEPVEVSLIVTPVSETSRVEKVVKEESRKEIEVIEGYVLDVIDSEETLAEKYTENLSDEEESMQELVEKEVLREEAKTIEDSGPEEVEEIEQTLEEEVLRGMEETGETSEEIEQDIRNEIQIPEQELQTDKWEQLKKTYPIVHPIHEEEEYLKIAPKDFVIFTEKYQELVHNSFLLHGYYNYKHLILGKKESDGKTIYYLGVPGTFHEREKTVAVMFGFEAFDGKREPAENGDFGYYLRKVEI